MNQYPKVSIVIPVYNVEAYITKCAESLFEQTYPNIEYIFIDDASTDDSFNVLNNIILKYKHRNIQIHRNTLNHGSSITRNIGLEKSSGDYLNFCDSDDWIEPNMIEEMVQATIKNGADIVTTPFYTNTFDKEKILSFKYNDISDLNKIPLDFLHFSLCNKLIRSSLIKENNISSLPNVNCWEDLSIISRLYVSSPKVIILDKPFYHYRKIKHRSLTFSPHERQLEDRMIYAEFLTNWFNEKYLSEKYAFFLHHLQFTAKIKMLRTSPRQYKRWKHTYPESNKYIMKYNDIPLHYRILFYLANIIIQ